MYNIVFILSFQFLFLKFFFIFHHCRRLKYPSTFIIYLHNRVLCINKTETVIIYKILNTLNRQVPVDKECNKEQLTLTFHALLCTYFQNNSI